MREIEFRLWDTKNQQMVHYIDHFIYLNGEIASFNADGVIEGLATHRHLIPLQYLGLTDDYGKKIYEGDIVRAYTAECNGYTQEPYIAFEIIGEVVYHYNSFVIKVGDTYNDLWTYAENYKVLGNAYENPELLSK